MQHIVIFIVVLFLYVHWVNQYKTSEDLEIYEMDFKSNKQLNDICELRQPVVFAYQLSSTNPISETVKIKDTGDIGTDEYVYLERNSAITLIETDSKSRFYSYGNDVDPMDNLDDLKPFLSVRTKCDILFGAEGSRTPCLYHTNSRRFLSISHGKIQVKMTPYKSRQFLKPFNDSGTNRSRMDVWKCQEKYIGDYEQIKFLEFDVDEGNILYVPPYWFYSIRFSSSATRVDEIRFSTPMNMIAFLPAQFSK
jgi:hypothetical protein